MALNMSLGMRLEQRLKMTAQMIQSIEMLQLPLMALEQQINQQLAENPTLEIAEQEVEVDPEELDRADRDEQTDFERLDEIARDEEWEDALYSSSSFRVRSSEEDPKLSAMQNTAARAETIQEFVAEQVRLSEADERTREIAEVMVFELDDNGYLLMSPEELFEVPEGEDPEPPAPVTPEEGAAALELIQSLDPAGVGARTVEECLLLQLARMEEDQSFEEKVVREHFDDLIHNRLPKVAHEMGVEIERVKEAIARIAQLNPRPGRDFEPRPPRYIVPDVIIEERDDEYFVRMNDGRMPPLRVSSVYKAMLKTQKRGSPAKEYLRDSLQKAKWLIDSIQQRRNTLLKISHEIVKAQGGFLKHGVSHLKPLMMQDVAADIGMHVSTVSRAIAEKYVDTPQGIYAMRYFFTGGYRTGASQDDTVSNKTVMNRIAQLVRDEDRRKPLSDAQIVKLLRADNVDIARRTVAKYREKLGIPASRQRKEY
jgi:RNA polymerase sigma-54 factor